MTTPTRSRVGRPFVALLLAALLALATGGIATLPAHAADGDADKSLKVSLVGDIDTFNPFLAVLLSSTGLNRYQYEALVGYGKNSEPVPGIAAEWETSDDGKEWTYTIPEDRKWSDGEQVTADDAEYTYSSIIDTPALQEANGGLVTNVASVEATDPQTFVITLKSAQASNPGQEIPIVPEHIWSKEDATKFKADADVVGSGPFTITAYNTGQTVEMKANPHFWRGKSKIDGLTFVSYKNSDAAVQGLKSGDIDLVDGLTPAQYESLENVRQHRRSTPASAAATRRSPSTPAPSTKTARSWATATRRSRTRSCARRSSWPSTRRPSSSASSTVSARSGRPRCRRRTRTTSASPTDTRPCRSTSLPPTRCWTTPATRRAPTASVRTSRASRSSSA